MADYLVNSDRLRSEADRLQALQQELNMVALRLAGIHISSTLRSSSSSALNNRIRDCRNAVSNQANNLYKLSNGLDSVAQLYDRTEKDLSEPKTSAQADKPLANGDSIWEWISTIVPFFRRDWPYILVLNPTAVLGTLAYAAGRGAAGLPPEWSLVSGRTEGTGNVWGIPCAGEAGFSLLGYETDTTAKAAWNLEKGDAGIEYGGEVSGHILKGDASGNFGILGGKINGSVGNVAVSGKVNATLFDDGKFTPSIGLEAKGEASVLKGGAEGYLGNESYNAHVKGSGTVLGAEAKAEGKLGVITYEDKKTGETVTAYGVKGEVGAEAYLAEGKVSGGFTIMGIDIDVGVSGKAGGVGVEAGGSVTTNGVSGEIGAGLGLGAGVEISVDWSDFDPPTMEEIGQGIQNVGHSIGEGLQTVGEGIQDAGEAISDFFNW